MSPEEEKILKAKVLGREAFEQGKPHSANPYPFREFNAHLAWFNAWLVRKVELEEGCKLRPKDDDGVENS